MRNLRIVDFFKKELDEEKTPRNPQEGDLWERIKAAPEDTMEQIPQKRDIEYLRRLVYEGVILKEEIKDYCVKNYVKKLEKTGNALSNNKTIFLEQVRMNERNQVLAGIMSQEAFIQKLIELLSYYADLELEDYRGWIEEDTYNKLLEAVFRRFLEV